MSVSALSDRTSVSVGRVLQAARLHKVLPLLAIMPIAALSFGTVDVQALVASAIYVFCIVTLGMHFNAITDRELDRRTKPHLSSWTMGAPRALVVLMAVEFAVGGAGLLWASSGSPLRLVALASLGVLSIVYSFNFLVPHRGGELRGKVHWLSHCVTIWGSYAALWLAGISAAREMPSLGFALPFALAWGLVDYGLFLHESANDAEEERKAGLRTLAALLGRVTTSKVALALLFVGAGFALLLLREGAPPGAAWLRTLLCLQVVGCALSAVAIHSRRSEKYTEHLVDVVFWSSRLVPLLGLIVLKS